MSDLHGDQAACERLWQAVIATAVDDIAYASSRPPGRRLKKHEQDRMRLIRENPPAEFVAGPWFRQICEWLGADSDVVAAAIHEAAA